MYWLLSYVHQIFKYKKLPPESQKNLLCQFDQHKTGSDIIKQVLTFARGTEQDFAPQQCGILFQN